MKHSMIIAATAAAIAVTSIAVPASATVTTFAQYQSIGGVPNLYWKNNGTGTNASNGTGGSIFTTATGSSATPGSRLVSFSFLQPAIAPAITDVAANFTLLASVTGEAASVFSIPGAGTFVVEPKINGSFSFTSTADITIGSTTYGAGANLLTGYFTNGTIAGARNGTSGAFSSTTTGGASITYTSDFLNFTPTVDRDFAISLTSITLPLNAAAFASLTPTKALRSFRANSTGSFSTDPAPLVNAVPEPTTWAMLVAGFGLVGAAARRRTIAVAA